MTANHGVHITCMLGVNDTHVAFDKAIGATICEIFDRCQAAHIGQLVKHAADSTYWLQSLLPQRGTSSHDEGSAVRILARHN